MPIGHPIYLEHFQQFFLFTLKLFRTLQLFYLICAVPPEIDCFYTKSDRVLKLYLRVWVCVCLFKKIQKYVVYIMWNLNAFKILVFAPLKVNVNSCKIPNEDITQFSLDIEGVWNLSWCSIHGLYSLNFQRQIWINEEDTIDKGMA